MINENIIDQPKQNSSKVSLSIAKILMTLAVYIISSATLLEHLSVITTLKTLGFILCAHSFYFLWKSIQEQ